MRFLFAIAVAVIVAFAATPSAHAGSLPRSMPRTLRGPEGMARCIEEPMSLAFDVVEYESARFLSPDSVSSRVDEVPASAMRTMRTLAQDALVIEPSMRLSNAPVPPTRKVARVLPCSRPSASASVCSSLGDSNTQIPLSSSFSHDELLLVALDVALTDELPKDRAAVALQLAPVYEIGFARDAHLAGPWRPPRA